MGGRRLIGRKNNKRLGEEGRMASVGEQKTNMLKSRIMARRPRPPDEILTREELEDLQRKLSKMSITAVQDFYQYTHSADCMFPGRFPTA